MSAVYWPLLAAGTALAVVLFVARVRRLIGVRVPVLRTLAAGIIAFLVFSPVVTAMIGGPAFAYKRGVLPALWFVILGVVIALVAACLSWSSRRC